MSFIMNDYERSKNLVEVDAIRRLPVRLKDDVLSCNESVASRSEAAQALSDAVCDSLKIPRIRICVRDSHQLFRNRKNSSATRIKTLGRCWKGRNIEIWNKTAKLQKVVSIKTFYGTLIHELMHHIDWTHFKLGDSPHTSGFYRRISYLDGCFK